MKTSEIKTQLPLVETIFEEKILTFSNVVRQKLVELAKLDKNEFDLTAQKWLNKCKYGSVHEGAQPFVSTFYRGDGALTASMQRTPEMTPEEMKELQHSLIRKWSFT
jgi:hypothetical protein